MSVSGDLLCSFELLKPLDSSALKSHIKKGRNKRNSMLNSPVSFFNFVSRNFGHLFTALLPHVVHIAQMCKPETYLFKNYLSIYKIYINRLTHYSPLWCQPRAIKLKLLDLDRPYTYLLL